MRRFVQAPLPSAVFLLANVLHASAEPAAEKMPPVEQLARFKCVAFAILGFAAVGLGMLALLGVCSVFKVQALRSDGERLRRHPVQGFLVGIVTALAAILTAIVIGVLPEPLNGLCGLAMVLSIAYMCVNGLCVVSHELGDRILGNLNSRYAGSSFASVLTGGTLIGVAGLAVGIGQAFQFFALVLGLGVFTGGLIARRRRPAQAAEPQEK